MAAAAKPSEKAGETQEAASAKPAEQPRSAHPPRRRREPPRPKLSQAAIEGKVPLGMIFIPYGPPTCHLMGRYTDGTGMPTSKGWEVEVEAI